MEEGYDHAGGGGSPPQQQLQQQLLMVDSALLDQGGEVEPSQTCPHLHACLRLPLTALPASMTRPCQGCGSGDEAWVCLSCGATRCSRYVNACAEAHFFESMDGASSDSGHHALVLSLSDLSVWCYACASYVKHDRLLPLLVRAEAIKFNAPEKTELLQGAQTSFHVRFAAPPALLRPPSAAAEGDGGGGKPTSTELAVDRLKERFLLAKAVCCPPPASDAADAIVAPLAEVLLSLPTGNEGSPAEKTSCGLAVLGSKAAGEEEEMAAVGAAVVQALAATGRPGNAILLRLVAPGPGTTAASPLPINDRITPIVLPLPPGDESLGSSSSSSYVTGLLAPPPSASSCPLVVLHAGAGILSSSSFSALALARRLAARARAKVGPPLLVVCGSSGGGWGCSVEGIQALLEALLTAQAEEEGGE